MKEDNEALQKVNKVNEHKLAQSVARFERLQKDISIKLQKEVEESTISKTKVMKYNGVIYLLHERKFLLNEQPVYKVGKTTCMNQRMRKYPKGSHLIFSLVCSNIHVTETKILELFRDNFKQRQDLGSEYFEGDMMSMVNNILPFFKTQT
jgi:hypothetical protein